MLPVCRKCSRTCKRLSPFLRRPQFSVRSAMALWVTAYARGRKLNEMSKSSLRSGQLFGIEHSALAEHAQETRFAPRVKRML
jgi:hypothetical protein